MAGVGAHPLISKAKASTQTERQRGRMRSLPFISPGVNSKITAPYKAFGYAEIWNMHELESSNMLWKPTYSMWPAGSSWFKAMCVHVCGEEQNMCVLTQWKPKGSEAVFTFSCFLVDALAWFVYICFVNVCRGRSRLLRCVAVIWNSIALQFKASLFNCNWH